jgi:hypothetical protein
VPARLHSLVQHTHDFDESGTEGAVKDHMNRLANGRLAAFVAAVPDMQRTPEDSSLRSIVDNPRGSAAIRRIAAACRAR